MASSFVLVFSARMSFRRARVKLHSNGPEAGNSSCNSPVSSSSPVPRVPVLINHGKVSSWIPSSTRRSGRSALGPKATSTSCFTAKGAHLFSTSSRECLDLVMICIATLDGARAVGFDVGDLEGELEKSLNEIERTTG